MAGILKQLGAAIINADEIARELVSPGSELLGQIVSQFGSSYLRSDGSLDRRRLGEAVFADASALDKLNRLFCLPLRREISRRVETIRRDNPEQPVVVEAAILFELGVDWLVDCVLVTDCSREEQVRRVMERGLSREEAEARVDSQRPAAESRRRADEVIDTGGSLAETRQRVESLWGDYTCAYKQQGTGQ